MGKFYGKIYCEEGVICEREFDTEAEAEAYVNGFRDTLEAIDADDDFHDACVDTNPAIDEEEPAPDGSDGEVKKP